MRKVSCLVMMIIFAVGSIFWGCHNAFSDDELTIVGELFPPYVYIDNEQFAGIDIEIARHIFDILGVTYHIEILPWARCWKYLQTGKADVGVTVSKKLEREEYVYYPKNHVWDASFVLLTNTETKATYRIHSLDDVKKHNLKVCVIRENSYHELFWEVFPWQDAERNVYHPQLHVAADIGDCLRGLENNRINVYPIPKTVGLYTAKKMGLTNITLYDEVLFSKPYPNVFSKASTFTSKSYRNITELMKAYDRELETFKKTSEYQAIFDKYEK